MNTSQRENILSVLREELQAMKTRAGGREMNEESHFKHDLGLDSLDIVEFVARTELHYRVHVPDDKFGELDTVGKVIDYILARTSVEKVE